VGHLVGSDRERSSRQRFFRTLCLAEMLVKDGFLWLQGRGPSEIPTGGNDLGELPILPIAITVIII